MILFQLFATSVIIYRQCCLMSLTMAENLLLISLTPVQKFSTGINNTSGTGGKICRWCREVRGVGKVANEKYGPW